MTNPITLIRDRLDSGKKWQKDSAGAYENDRAPLCLLGAGTWAQQFRRLHAHTLDQDVQAVLDTEAAYTVIRAVIEEQFPERVASIKRSHDAADYDSPFSGTRLLLFQFNDFPLTTWPDLELTLDKAALAWDETHSAT